jgi:hypothetical protein
VLRWVLVTIAASLVVASAAIAAPKDRRAAERAKLLWATVNFCDTELHPDAVGIRASMPGRGRKGETMWMRIKLQHQQDGFWEDFTGPGAGFRTVKAGSSRFRDRQSGWEFPFKPEAGQSFRVRGVVRFEWRRRGKVVRRVTKTTSARRRPAVADPAGYSAASCVIAGATG